MVRHGAHIIHDILSHAYLLNKENSQVSRAIMLLLSFFSERKDYIEKKKNP